MNKEEMAADYASGMTVRQVSEKHGMSIGKAFYVLRDAGCVFRSRGIPKKQPTGERVHRVHLYSISKQPKWSETEIEYVRERYPVDGAQSVAMVLGRSKTAVQHCASRHDIEREDAAEFRARSTAQKLTANSKPNFRGYRRKTAKGYIVLYKPGYPGASKHGLIMEHRYVMSEHIGRVIKQDEAVHHINGNIGDNRIENLMLMGHGEHSTFHNILRGKKNKTEEGVCY